MFIVQTACSFLLFLNLFAFPLLQIGDSFFTPNDSLCYIDHKIDLHGAKFVVEKNMTLVFVNNGYLDNGVLIGQDSKIENKRNKAIFGDNLLFDGCFASEAVYEWFYDSNITIKNKKIHIYNTDFQVKTVEGVNSWRNIITVLSKVRESFPGLFFGKSYLLNNPSGAINTSANQLVFDQRLDRFRIHGGVFYGAGLTFSNWHNIEIFDMKIFARYFDWDKDNLNINEEFLSAEGGEALCYNRVGLCLSNANDCHNDNDGAFIHNIIVDRCFNGIYIGRWSEDGKKVSANNVVVKDCKSHHAIYHCYATSHSNNVEFINCSGNYTYLGMLIDMSRGSQNISFHDGYGYQLSMPFKMQSYPDCLITKNCAFYNNHLVMTEKLQHINGTQCINIGGTGYFKINNNVIEFNDNKPSTIFNILGLSHDLHVDISGNSFQNIAGKVLFGISKDSASARLDKIHMNVSKNVFGLSSNNGDMTMFYLRQIYNDAKRCKNELKVLFDNNVFRSVGLNNVTLYRSANWDQNGSRGYFHCDRNVFDFSVLNLVINNVSAPDFALQFDGNTINELSSSAIINNGVIKSFGFTGNQLRVTSKKPLLSTTNKIHVDFSDNEIKTDNEITSIDNQGMLKRKSRIKNNTFSGKYSTRNIRLFNQ